MIKHMFFSSEKNTITRGEGGDYKIPKNSDFAWLFMQNPVFSEVTKVCKDFSVDLKHFKTFSKENRSARYSINPLIFVFMDYYLEKGKIKSSRILFILKENVLIIVMQKKTIFHSDLFDKLTAALETSNSRSLAGLMYRFLMEDVDENYDVLELARAKYGVVLANGIAVKTITKNLATGFNRDLQLTKKPLIESFETTLETLKIMTLVVSNLKVNKDKLKKAMTPELCQAEKALKLAVAGVHFRDAYLKVKETK